VDGVDDRARGQSAEARAPVVPADRLQISDSRQRPGRETAPPQPARLSQHDPVGALQAGCRRTGPRGGDGRSAHAGERGRQSGPHDAAVINYIRALNKGILKVMSKMGISTVQSYCGAQIFEAIGLSSAFVDRFFTSTPSRIGGVGIDVIAEETRMRHDAAFPT